MSLCVPALFLGPYQTPFYRLPIDASKLHPKLFDTARTFLGGNDLDGLELLHILINYCVWTGRLDQVGEYTGRAMGMILEENWLDENSPCWDLPAAVRGRARQVIWGILASYK